MIRHTVFFQPEYVWNKLVRHLIYRERRHVTSCYTYSSHGLFYVLFLLIYGIMRVTANGGDSIIISEAQTGITNDKHLNGLDQLVADIRPDDPDYEYVDEEERDYKELISNKSGNYNNEFNSTEPLSFPNFAYLFAQHDLAKGMYIGAPCEQRCTGTLHHVHCDAITGLCACEKKYPVVIGLTKGCAKR